MAQPTATYDDANLLLRLYELRREDKLREARAWFVANCYAESVTELAAKYGPQSDESRMMRMVTSYWEMVASFLASGLLNKELFFASGREMLLVWTRMQHLVPELRATYKDQSLYKNLELACNDYIQHLNRHSPDAYAAFQARSLSMFKKQQ